MATIKRPLTQCGLYGHRARVIGRDGEKLTYRWPCGHEKTEVLTIGPPGIKKPAGLALAERFARYWAGGVTYECPKCRRRAISDAKKKTT